jgi:hypothetical protein
MYEDGPNPTKVQVTPVYKRANPPPPLVLIHDGGGTTFGYFMLGSLYREVWAIHNPHFFDGGAFEGGMDEMARLYIQNMKDAGIKGNILLGGMCRVEGQHHLVEFLLEMIILSVHRNL